MNTVAPVSTAEEILAAAKKTQTNFPTDECRKLALETGMDYQSLVSGLDTYFYDIWSPANGVKRLTRKSEVWLRELRTDLAQSFFERAPQYASLEAKINPRDTPELSRRLADFDALRRNLIAYLLELL